MYSDPHLVHVWSDKDGGKAQWRAFKEAFEKDKKNSLYSGCRALTELYEYWGYSSDWGSHTSIAALATRFRQSNSSGEIGWNVDYFEVEESRVAMTLYSILDVSFHMECVFYEVFQQRFKLDPSLVDLRTRFLEMRGALAQSIQKRYGKDVNSRAPGA
jgi:hypothetical protein